MAGLDEFQMLLSQVAVEQAENVGNMRFYRQRQDVFELPEKKFIKLFRINKGMADEVVNYLQPHMKDCCRSSALTAEEKILGSLRLFAAGSYQQDVGQNCYISMSQPSISRSVHEVIDAVHSSTFFKRKVKFYSNLTQLKAARQKFYNKHGFPGVVGCIDCTHVAIVPPPKDSITYPEHIYVNRKGYHSINVQLVCDADLKIINVNAKYPGSTHDSFIWNNSNVLPAMTALNRRYPGHFCLIGDSGYALRSWMLTPIADAARGTPQSNYNRCLRSTRSIIERVNGILKMRFRCLLKHRVLHYDPETASKIVNTCCALHNMCIENNLPDVPPEEGEDILEGLDASNGDDNLEEVIATRNPLLAEGIGTQRTIVRRYFS